MTTRSSSDCPDTPGTEPTLFDPERGAELRDDGIARAEAHAEVQWKDAALDAVLACARQLPRFTTDEVYAHGLLVGYSTHELRAMGGIMRRACTQGWIVPTDDYRPTARPEAHRRPMRVWRSLVYREGRSDV